MHLLDGIAIITCTTRGTEIATVSHKMLWETMSMLIIFQAIVGSMIQTALLLSRRHSIVPLKIILVPWRVHA